MTAPAAQRVQPEDLLAMQDGHRFELIDGELVERNMSVESSVVAFRLNMRLGVLIEERGLGFGFQADCGLMIFPWKHRGRDVRFADGGFVARGRVPAGYTGKGHLTLAPDLIFEVVSPNDLAEEVETKVADYLQAGVKLVWVLHPETETVYVQRADRTSSRLAGDDVLSGESVIPGFEVVISELFAALA